MPKPDPSANSSFRRPFAVVLAAAFTITVFKGFRLPSLWSATHFAFNYSQGFVRRALVGEVARRLFGDNVYTYRNFLAFSYLVLAACGALVGWLIARVLRERQEDWGLRVVLLAFAASPALVFFVHMVGYLDNVGLLMVLLFLIGAERLKNAFVPPALVSVVGVLLLLVHEGLCVMFLPTLFFFLVCHALRSHRARPFQKWMWAVLAAEAVLAVAPVLIGAVLLSRSGAEHGARVSALVDFMRQHVDFPIRGDAVETLTRSSEENMRRIVPWYWSLPSSRRLALANFSAFLPGLGVLVYFAVVSIGRLRLPRAQSAAMLATFVAATFSPLLMNFVGWDWPRWNGIALVDGMIALLAMLWFFKAEAGSVLASGARFLAIGVVATFIGLASDAFLFDDYRVQYFPFERQFELLERLWKDDFKTRPPG